MNIILRRSRNWQDFKTLVSPLDKKQKGDIFEVLVRHFFLIHPTYQTQLKNVWPLRKVPIRIRTKLNLPAPDEGIDLIAETKDGKYWAIQCKYREDENKSLTRKELSTFTDLAFNVCRSIDFALVCTTADRFSHKLKLYGERLSFCTGEVWRSLSPEFFQRLHQLIEGKIVYPEPLKPRPHQQQAIENAITHFMEEGNSRGKLIMPCGTGKSLAGYWIARKFKTKSILIAVPSLALIRQTYEVWARESVANKHDIDWIAVCSDESVGDIERDDIVVLTQDLGIRVHTNPNKIAGWLREKKNATKVVFTTYQSGRAISEAAQKAKKVFDVGIMDEAHKTVGKRESLFSHLLYDENIRIRKRIFMTATERRYRGQSEQIASMDEPKLYGETFEMLSFKRALEASPPILSDYKIITVAVTREEIAKLIEENIFVRPDKGKWDDDVEAQMLAATVALRKAMEKHPIRHAVSFHSSIARARAYKATQEVFNQSFPAFGNLDTFHVCGKTPTAIRSRELEEFASAERSLVTNARCLTEGVDVPDIDCVLFADPRRSTIDIVQAVGRALRVAEGKQQGYVVVPVLMDKEISDPFQSKGNGFAPILMVLRALAANDDRIIEYFRTISQGRKWTGGTIPFEIEISEGVLVDAEEFVNSINLHFWSRLAKLSWRPFLEAREFIWSLRLINKGEWYNYCRGDLPGKGDFPEDMPGRPDHVYRNQGWKGWGDWLGTETVATFLRTYRPFLKAREFVHGLGLKNIDEWGKYCQGDLPEKGNKPKDIPSNPQGVYKEQGWAGMGDWLGTGAVATFLRTYRPFQEAREFVHGLRLRNSEEWWKYVRGELPDKEKLPEDIPSRPDHVYKDQGWQSWGDWFGTGFVHLRLRKYRPFLEARKFVHGLGMRNIKDWYEYSRGDMPQKGKKPEDIPSSPYHFYKDQGWQGYGDWLGTETVATHLRVYRPFPEARKFVHSLGIKSYKEWWNYCRGKLPGKGEKPKDIPSDPYSVYKHQGWQSWVDWLGMGRTRRKKKLGG